MKTKQAVFVVVAIGSIMMRRANARPFQPSSDIQDIAGRARQTDLAEAVKLADREWRQIYVECEEAYRLHPDEYIALYNARYFPVQFHRIEDRIDDARKIAWENPGGASGPRLVSVREQWRAMSSLSQARSLMLSVREIIAPKPEVLWKTVAALDHAWRGRAADGKKIAPGLRAECELARLNHPNEYAAISKREDFDSKFREIESLIVELQTRVGAVVRSHETLSSKDAFELRVLVDRTWFLLRQVRQPVREILPPRRSTSL